MTTIVPNEYCSFIKNYESQTPDTNRVETCEFKADLSIYFDCLNKVNSGPIPVSKVRKASTLLYEGPHENLTGVYYLHDEDMPKPLVSKRVKPRLAAESDLSLQKWEGQVLEVYSDSFTARLTDITAKGAKEDAEFPLSQVADDDRNLLQSGAIFYWSIGRKHDSTNRPSIVSELRMRRLPDWSDDEITKASLEAEDLANHFRIK
jgi:hypothetical protein